MATVTYEFRIGKYTLLRVEPFPPEKFTSVTIEGTIYDVKPTYDLDNCITIQEQQAKGFVGKETIFKQKELHK